MFINPIDKLIKYADSADNKDFILIKGGMVDEDDSSSSSNDDTYPAIDENMESYIGSCLGGVKKAATNNITNNIVNQPKFKTIVNLLSKSSKTRLFTKYDMNKIIINEADKPVKLFIIFDANQFKKNFNKTSIKTDEIFNIIKTNDSMFLMCGNTSNTNFKYSNRMKTKSSVIFKKTSIPIVAIFSLNKKLEFYEEFNYETVKEQTMMENNQVLVYKLLDRIICAVKDLKHNLLDIKLFYVDHETDVKLIEIKNNVDIFKNYEQKDVEGEFNYKPLSMSNDLPLLFTLIYPYVTKFNLTKQTK